MTDSVERSRRLLTGSMSEAELDRDLLEAFRLGRWLAVHYRPARRANGQHRTALQGDPGGPDWLAIRPPYLLMLESKAEGGRLGPAQQVWQEQGRQVTKVLCGVVKPSNLLELRQFLADPAHHC